MPEEILSDKDVAELEQQFLAAMPANGSIGEHTLRSKLGWDEDNLRYFRRRLLRTQRIDGYYSSEGSWIVSLPKWSDTE